MIVESPVELKDHGRLLIARWWLRLALLETGLILAGVLSLVSGSAQLGPELVWGQEDWLPRP